MAAPIEAFSIVEVGKPNVGEKKPSVVRADVHIMLNARYVEELAVLFEEHVKIKVNVHVSAPV